MGIAGGNGNHGVIMGKGILVSGIIGHGDGRIVTAVRILAAEQFSGLPDGGHVHALAQLAVVVVTPCVHSARSGQGYAVAGTGGDIHHLVQLIGIAGVFELSRAGAEAQHSRRGGHVSGVSGGAGLILVVAAEAPDLSLIVQGQGEVLTGSHLGDLDGRGAVDLGMVIGGIDGREGHHCGRGGAGRVSQTGLSVVVPAPGPQVALLIHGQRMTGAGGDGDDLHLGLSGGSCCGLALTGSHDGGLDERHLTGHVGGRGCGYLTAQDPVVGDAPAVDLTLGSEGQGKVVTGGHHRLGKCVDGSAAPIRQLVVPVDGQRHHTQLLVLAVGAHIPLIPENELHIAAHIRLGCDGSVGIQDHQLLTVLDLHIVIGGGEELGSPAPVAAQVEVVGIVGKDPVDSQGLALQHDDVGHLAVLGNVPDGGGIAGDGVLQGDQAGFLAADADQAGVVRPVHTLTGIGGAAPGGQAVLIAQDAVIGQVVLIVHAIDVAVLQKHHSVRSGHPGTESAGKQAPGVVGGISSGDKGLAVLGQGRHILSRDSGPAVEHTGMVGVGPDHQGGAIVEGSDFVSLLGHVHPGGVKHAAVVAAPDPGVSVGVHGQGEIGAGLNGRDVSERLPLALEHLHRIVVAVGIAHADLAVGIVAEGPDGAVGLEEQGVVPAGGHIGHIPGLEPEPQGKGPVVHLIPAQGSAGGAAPDVDRAVLHQGHGVIVAGSDLGDLVGVLVAIVVVVVDGTALGRAVHRVIEGTVGQHPGVLIAALVGGVGVIGQVPEHLVAQAEAVPVGAVAGGPGHADEVVGQVNGGDGGGVAHAQLAVAVGAPAIDPVVLGQDQDKVVPGNDLLHPGEIAGGIAAVADLGGQKDGLVEGMTALEQVIAGIPAPGPDSTVSPESVSVPLARDDLGRGDLTHRGALAPGALVTDAGEEEGQVQMSGTAGVHPVALCVLLLLVDQDVGISAVGHLVPVDLAQTGHRVGEGDVIRIHAEEAQSPLLVLLGALTGGIEAGEPHRLGQEAEGIGTLHDHILRLDVEGIPGIQIEGELSGGMVGGLGLALGAVLVLGHHVYLLEAQVLAGILGIVDLTQVIQTDLRSGSGDIGAQLAVSVGTPGPQTAVRLQDGAGGAGEGQSVGLPDLGGPIGIQAAVLLAGGLIAGDAGGHGVHSIGQQGGDTGIGSTAPDVGGAVLGDSAALEAAGS